MSFVFQEKTYDVAPDGIVLPAIPYRRRIMDAVKRWWWPFQKPQAPQPPKVFRPGQMAILPVAGWPVLDDYDQLNRSDRESVDLLLLQLSQSVVPPNLLQVPFQLTGTVGRYLPTIVAMFESEAPSVAIWFVVSPVHSLRGFAMKFQPHLVPILGDFPDLSLLALVPATSKLNSARRKILFDEYKRTQQ